MINPSDVLQMISQGSFDPRTTSQLLKYLPYLNN